MYGSSEREAMGGASTGQIDSRIGRWQPGLHAVTSEEIGGLKNMFSKSFDFRGPRYNRVVVEGLGERSS
jgi:hypothetical protein